MKSMPPCYLPALGIVNALGRGKHAVSHGLMSGNTSAMRLEEGWLREGHARVGRVCAQLPDIPAQFAQWRCRNNRLLLAAVEEIADDIEGALARYGRSRVGIVLGSSTSGIAEGEQALDAYFSTGELPPEFHYAQQEIGMPALFLARYLGTTGPAWTVSTACTSSAKAFGSARNLLHLGLCDAVLVGGVDSLCRLTIRGFAALESITSELANPMSVNRKGINIGEGAALFLMTREPAATSLLGIGESSDAYHISAPDPSGRGAENAMRSALTDARLPVEALDYVNLHATATPKNDEMESRAIARFLTSGVPVSGTKAMTGHLLGAAGATELAFCWLALQGHERRLPPHVWDGKADPALPALRFVAPGEAFSPGEYRHCMSNSFAFGGNNISIVIGDAR